VETPGENVTAGDSCRFAQVTPLSVMNYHGLKPVRARRATRSPIADRGAERSARHQIRWPIGVTVLLGPSHEWTVGDKLTPNERISSGLGMGAGASMAKNMHKESGVLDGRPWSFALCFLL